MELPGALVSQIIDEKISFALKELLGRGLGT